MIGRASTAALALALAACTAGESVAEDGSEAAAGEVTGFVADVSATELSSKLERGEVRLIDVRTAEEVAAGAIEGAEHIPLDELAVGKLTVDHDRPIVFYCRSGRRSAEAAERLGEYTGKTQMHLLGGILAWEEAGLPVVTTGTAPEAQAAIQP